MRAFAKSMLISIFAVIVIMLFTNLVFFFPWYMTLVVETFNVTQYVASDNYLKESYYNDTKERLEKRPIFSQKANDIKIVAEHEDHHSTKGNDDVYDYEKKDDADKPYRQRGESVIVTISAVYPLSVKLWGERYEREIPVSFTLKTTGLKHYKDLEYDEYLENWNGQP
ncbi:hypothetical protein [Paenibacillus lutimineralis]|uniref:Uncharacterized protein n=1 Tax=Paenibacillus lutimineralis TaxID=2707005 RepID=A0A3S9UUN9_9BACL|nr:hypothetical protein [Paenibacillus lutimineralis]AZS14035.1 hypothetical protein EI981_05920 [Paenibacillus lutimineralis]